MSNSLVTGKEPVWFSWEAMQESPEQPRPDKSVWPTHFIINITWRQYTGGPDTLVWLKLQLPHSEGQLHPAKCPQMPGQRVSSLRHRAIPEPSQNPPGQSRGLRPNER